MHILAIGAHPDDCDFCCGGSAALWAQRGDHVKFVSVTNGDRGHMDSSYIRHRHALASRRMAEAKRAVGIVGGEFDCMNVPDGEVYVTRELTEQMIRVIRRAAPDLVLLNRPADYHRDHRYTAQLVLDASYMLTVPLMCEDVPHLQRMPVFAYWYDGFHEGGAFRADVVVPIDAVIERKTQMLAQHVSQVFEWLPYNHGTLEQVPKDEAARVAWLRGQLERNARWVAQACGEGSASLAKDCQLAEAFQISEYGRRPSADELGRLFPLTNR